MSNVVRNEELVRYVDTAQIQTYINEVYKNVIDYSPEWMFEVRHVGKYSLPDGTTAPAEQSIAAQLLQFSEDNWQQELGVWVANKALAIAPLGVGTFMAPAVLNDRRATDKSVKLLTTICADFDTGNPAQLLREAINVMGVRPTMVCTSGGITPEGYHKLHAHWRLNEPHDEPWKIAYIREQLAKKFGADQSFKRIPQIIRVAGALYDKDGHWTRTEIVELNSDIEADAMGIEDNLGIDYDRIEEDSLFSPTRTQKTAEQKEQRLHQLHTEEVEAGRSEDTRWDRFSEYAGHQIRQARFNHQSIEQAYESTRLWVNDKMVPAWEPSRVEAEFKALLGRDQVQHAEQWAEKDKPALQLAQAPVPANAQQPAPEQQAPAQQPVALPEEPWLDIFDTGYLYVGEALKERHLIENFLVHGSYVGLVADGGVGKTYLALDLAMRAAAGPGLPNNKFLGFPILEKMFVVVLTVEDGQHDIHRRICAIDSDGSLREASKGYCKILPVKEQIINGLTLAEKDTQNNFTASRAWRAVIDHIKIARVGKEHCPLLVMIDTYSATHHGDENNATGANEWFRAASLLSQFEATLMLTHHVRKTDPKFEIKTPSDMKNAVRGSTALLNSLRTVYGVWEMPNDTAVLKEMNKAGIESGSRLFNMGILKNNTGIDWEDRSDPRYKEPMITLRRLGNGRLVYDAEAHQKRIDLSAKKSERLEDKRAQLRAAITHVCRFYAEKGYPLSLRNVTKKDGIRKYFGSDVNVMAETEFDSAVTELVNNGTLKQLEIKGIRGHILDVPDGQYSMSQMDRRLSEHPAHQWSHYLYDAENEEYVLQPNLQHTMDLDNV